MEKYSSAVTFKTHVCFLKTCANLQSVQGISGIARVQERSFKSILHHAVLLKWYHRGLSKTTYCVGYFWHDVRCRKRFQVSFASRLVV